MSSRLVEKLEKLRNIEDLYFEWNKNIEKMYSHKEIEWKIIRGHFIFEKEYQLNDALKDIEIKVVEWGWTIVKHNDYNTKIIENKDKDIQKHLHKRKKNPSEQLTDLIWESGDDFYRSYNKISKLFNEL